MFFWAGWCIPCKEELALVASKKELLQNFQVVAINVDEDSDWAVASSALTSLNWPFASARDPGGRFFYDFNPSGDLPVVLQLDATGALTETFRKIDATTLETLSHIRSPEKAAEGPFSFFLDSRYREQPRRKGDSSGRAAFSSSSGAQFRSGSVDVRAAYDILRQKRGSPSTRWTRFEDDIGRSHAEIRGGAFFQGRLRLGDDQPEWMNGLLWTQRPTPSSPLQTSLTGVHARIARDANWELEMGAGRVRSLLAPISLDLSQDLSQGIPKENAGVAWGRLRLSETPHIALQAGGAASESAAAPELGSPTRESAWRAGTGLEISAGPMEAAGRVVRYGSSLKGGHAGSAQTGFNQIWTRNSEGKATQTHLDLSFAEEKHIPRHAAVLSLVSDAGTPLDADAKRSTRVLAKNDWGSLNVSLTTSWTHERSFETSAQDIRNHGSVVLAAPALSSKGEIYLMGDHLKSLETKQQETALLLATPLLPSLSWQGKYRHSSIAPLSRGQTSTGDTVLINMDWTPGDLFLPLRDAAGRVALQGFWGWQKGNFRESSGLDVPQLGSLFLSWSRGNHALRVGGGKEPGGTVCAGGVCAKRPPMDGWSVEGRTAITF